MEDLRVAAEGELSNVARSFITVKNLIKQAIVIGVRFDDLSIFEGKSDIPEEMSAIGRRGVIGDCSVDRVFDRGRSRRECSFRLHGTKNILYAG